MADKQSYLDLTVVNDLITKAAARDTQAIANLTDIMNCAEQQYFNEWKEKAKQTWLPGLVQITTAMDSENLTAEDIALLKVMLKFKFEGMEFRDRYAAMAKAIFKDYQNPTALIEALGCRDVKNNLSKVAARMQMMEYAKPGTLCYDRSYGIGEILDIDPLNNELMIMMEHRRMIPLQRFLDSMYVIKKDSQLAEIVARTFTGKFENAVDFSDAMKNAIVCVQPFSIAIIKLMLVPAKMSESAFSAISNGKDVAQLAKGGKNAKSASEKPASNAEVSHWDNSRSVAELVGRLKDLDDLTLENPNIENIHNILEASAARVDQAENFANAVAMLIKGGIYNFALIEGLKTFADRTACWNNSALFVEISDELPGKIVSYWFQAAKAIMGSDWLVENTIKMPYRLWTYTEKLLAQNKEEASMLSDRVFACFNTGKVNAEMFFWLWKAKDSELRTKFMSDSYLLFKTLRIEVKGSYLKSQRTLHHLLVDDEKFQRTVMANGSEAAIQALTHCVKHLPLLDAGERQAVLVKIVRCYPEAKSIVEERKVIKRSVGNITSPRSYNEAQKELQNLIDVLIPENITAIEHARSLGDLRENSEFKFAKERQRELGSRRSELERILAETRTVNFGDVKVGDTIVPGCVVTLTYKDGRTDQFTLLGRLDTDTDKNFISYEAPLGKALMNKDLEEEIEMPSGEIAVITAIKPLPADLVNWLNTIA